MQTPIILKMIIICSISRQSIMELLGKSIMGDSLEWQKWSILCLPIDVSKFKRLLRLSSCFTSLLWSKKWVRCTRGSFSSLIFCFSFSLISYLWYWWVEFKKYSLGSNIMSSPRNTDLIILNIEWYSSYKMSIYSFLDPDLSCIWSCW